MASATSMKESCHPSSTTPSIKKASVQPKKNYGRGKLELNSRKRKNSKTNRTLDKPYRSRDIGFRESQRRRPSCGSGKNFWCKYSTRRNTRIEHE